MSSADHPLKGLLDRIWNEGHTPRLIINATHKDVLIPEWLRAQHKERLILDLQADYPMNIEFDLEKLSADLAFSGSVVRCTVPWKRIIAVFDRDTGHGVRITDPEMMDEGAKKLVGALKEPEPEAEQPKRKFGVIQGGKK